MKMVRGFFGWLQGDRRPLTPRQRAWLLRGAVMGALLVCLSQWPRWSAWLQWWQRVPLTAQVQQPLAPDRLVLARHWAQQEAALDRMDAASHHWHALRERLARHGLRVLQWQVLDGPVPAPGAWPLVVQRARLQLQGDASAWPAISQSAAWPGGLWRLDSLSGQTQAGEGGLPVWGWQAEWSLALRPATGPQETSANAGPAVSATVPVRDAMQGSSAQSPVDDGIRESASPAATMATALPDMPGSSAEARGVRGEGLQITDWPLTQLQWVGLWRHGDVQEALFRAQDRLFRVRPGEAVGLDGHRWVAGDARQLVLLGSSATAAGSEMTVSATSAGSDAATVEPAVTGPSSWRLTTVEGSHARTTILIWEGKP